MDFKSLRSDKLKLTQEEFANLYGISIQEVQDAFANATESTLGWFGGLFQ